MSQASERPGRTEIESVSASTTKASAKILVAEDADDLRDAILLVLVEQGYRVQAARDGFEATQMFPDFDPDLVVLDMRMPKMSGPNTCAAIRKTSNLPVIMFTSSNEAEDVREAITKGATDFVLKTTGVSELTERISFHLSKSEAPEAKEKETNARKIASPPIKQKVTTTTLIVDPNEESRSIIKAVLTRLNQNVVEASNAAEAIKTYKTESPDIVISEWSLPDMDAFNMMSELKGGKFDKNLVKGMISARLSPEAQRKASFVGIENFLQKPLSAAKVEMMIANCVRTAIRARKRKSRNAA
ncbi:response regulator [Candidatus Lucifugimonas marina]